MNHGWIMKYDTITGRFYFGNVLTKKSQWTIPENTILTQCDEYDWVIKMKDGDFYFVRMGSNIHRTTMHTIPTKKVMMGTADVSERWTMHYGDEYCWFHNTSMGESQWEIPIVTTNKHPMKKTLEMGYLQDQVYFEDIKGNILCHMPCAFYACDSIRGLEWVGNSCYLDSVLVALFAVPCEFTNRILHDPIPTSTNTGTKCTVQGIKSVQSELNKLVSTIRSNDGTNTTKVTTCSNLRAAFKQCGSTQNFWDSNTKDAGEFLTFLFSLFPQITEQAEMIEEVYYKNIPSPLGHKDRTASDTQVHTKLNSIWNVYSTYLSTLFKSKPDGVSISSLVTIRFIEKFSDKELLTDPNSGKKYNSRIMTQTLNKTPYLVFNLFRKTGEDINKNTSNTKKSGLQSNFIDIQVTPDKLVHVGSSVFTLCSIVVYVPGHYVCYFLCNNTWYYYNDLSIGIKQVGSYEDMLVHEPSPTRQGILYFYNPMV